MGVLAPNTAVKTIPLTSLAAVVLIIHSLYWIPGDERRMIYHVSM
ncbi:MAG: hypothetical protein J07HX5_01985 [halophilic archaeon J07HX5]|nr:MAG: hypothetical protein J07HX5_01985 [halophilic archaeon J07HX5]